MQQTLTQTLWMRKVRSMPCWVWCQRAHSRHVCRRPQELSWSRSALVLTLTPPAVMWLPARLPACRPAPGVQ